MQVKHVFAIFLVLVWATSAHAQYRERERYHEHFRERDRGLPPAFMPVAPRRGGYEEHAVIPRHAGEPVRTGRAADGPICDNADNDPDAAIAACGRIIARGPTRNGYSLVIAYIHRGQAYESKGDSGHAIADFSEAIRRQPGVPVYFAMRGAALEKSGDPDAAQGDFRRAVSLDPKNQEALNGLRRIETRSALRTDGATNAPPAPVGTVALPSPVAAASPPKGAMVPQPAAIGEATPPSVATASPPSVATAAPPKPLGAAPPPAPVNRASAPAVAATAAPLTQTVTSPPAAPVVAETSTTPSNAHGPRVALVIGNGAYVNANVLPNPPNDAHAIAGVLRQIGFDVQEGENLGHAAMESQLQAFLHKAANASVVLLFYAGHGMQVDGKNYLVPVDAKLAEASDLPFETIEIDKLLDSLGDPGHTNIILLDACRDNPLARSFASHLPATRSAAVSTGLAPYSAIGTGTLIAYATAPGQTALDGQGKDSPFTTSLLHFLPTPGLEIRQVLTRVRAEVASQTGNRQIPWDNSSLMGDVVLVK